MIVDDLDLPCFAIAPSKQIRHCSLTRMLYCPRRSPLNVSSRLPGGTLRSSSRKAASSTMSFALARCWICIGMPRTAWPTKIAALRLSAKLLITNQRNDNRYDQSRVSGPEAVHDGFSGLAANASLPRRRNRGLSFRYPSLTPSGRTRVSPVVVMSSRRRTSAARCEDAGGDERPRRRTVRHSSRC